MNTTYDGAVRPRPLRRLLAVAGMRRERARDLRDTWQVAAGAVLFPLGIAVILLAWYGAAHTGHVQQQIPYLVSGSFLGLGFMITGGLLYFAHWLYRIYDQADLHHQASLRQQEALLRELVGALAVAVPVATATGAAPAGVEVEGAGDWAGDQAGGTAGVTNVEPAAYVATASGTNYHRPECAIVQRRRSGLRHLAESDVAAMTPCRMCDPG